MDAQKDVDEDNHVQKKKKTRPQTIPGLRITMPEFWFAQAQEKRYPHPSALRGTGHHLFQDKAPVCLTVSDSGAFRGLRRVKAEGIEPL